MPIDKIPERSGKAEAMLQSRIIDFLELRQWHCRVMHGNLFQFGFPDLYIDHKDYGHRLVEVKVLEQFSFTPAQEIEFPKFNSGIWILIEASESEYRKLWQPPNWGYYMYLHKNKRGVK